MPPTPTAFQLSPQYDPREVEARLYQRWLASHAFTVPADTPKTPYVIVIPPPNVTAVLHVGHGMNDVIQDVVIRFERMRGRGAEWLPGTDHAGIATQNVVEKLVAAEGKTRFDLGRERFVERIWAFVRETGGVILEQLKTIGCSCDWGRTVFTLDPKYSQAVREAFVRLWEEGRIYRGHRVIHWCPHCLTSLSDEEAEFADETGKLYHIRYRVDGGPKPFLTVATTRPETMLGDTAIAVHPEDSRHAGFIGKTAHIPLTDIAIPIIADEAVDPKFGTGFVKVTPAHDANDFEIGTRHKLAMPIVMTADGKMGEERALATGSLQRVPAALRGLDRFEARDRIVKQLKEQGLLDKVEPHPHAVRHCYRCDTVVEPRLSDQWFVAMKDLAAPALAAYQSGAVRFLPERWGATYEHWMANIRDWNISRQLWWGHRIPVFTCSKCNHVWAARQDPSSCPKCGDKQITQDPDVLDTWFSSWLWPFAAFGWPEATPELKRFYPGHTLVTAPEILFFWVARMIMSGLHFMDKRLPFTTVYLHGTVRDTQHRKMSKSLGNGIDPLDVVRLYGADALRWTLIAGSSLGADVVLDPNDLETTFAPGRNFANKLWNIGRFVLGQLPSEVPTLSKIDSQALTIEDRWILSRLQSTIREVTTSFEQFRLDEGAKRCFDFVWKELADRYVEAVKTRLPASDGDSSATAGARWAAAEEGAPTRAAAQAVLANCFDAALRLLHPVVPFITEELWQKLPSRNAGDLLATAEWPVAQESLNFPDAAPFSIALDAVDCLRSAKAGQRIPSSKILAGPLWVISAPTSSDSNKAVLKASGAFIKQLGRVSEVAFVDVRPEKVGPSIEFPIRDGFFGVLPIGDAIDLDGECKRLRAERDRLEKQLNGLVAKLANENFVARAPADVVAREREKEREWRLQRDALDGTLKSLGCS